MIIALVIFSVIAIFIAITVTNVDVHIFPSSGLIAISFAGPWCGLVLPHITVLTQESIDRLSAHFAQTSHPGLMRDLLNVTKIDSRHRVKFIVCRV
jgi:hypothetical protein